MVNVAIIEDEFLVALDLEDIVTGAGYDVIGIVSDLRGLETLNRSPAVALVDVNLRDGRTGPTIARHLAQQFGTRIVFVTANPEQIDELPPTTLGYIEKPFTSEDIVGAIALAADRTDRRPRRLRPLS